MTRGIYAFDYGDTAGMAPIVKMETLATTLCPRGSMLAACVITACRPSSRRYTNST